MIIEQQPEYLEFITGASGRFPEPRHAMIILSEKAGRSCTTQPEAQNPEPGQQQVLRKSVLDTIILNVIPYLKTLTIVGSEDTLDPQGPIPYLLTFTKEFALPTTLYVCTCSLSESILYQLVQQSLRTLCFHLTAVEVEYLLSENLPEPITLPSTIAKLGALKKAAKATNPDVVLHVGLAEIGANALSLLEWSQHQGVSGLVVGTATPQPPKVKGSPKRLSAKELLSLLDKTRTQARKLGITLTLQNQQALYPLGALDDLNGLNLPSPCLSHWTTLTIAPNGDVISCPLASESMGNIYWQSLREIWFGARSVQHRRTLISQGGPHCRECLGKPSEATNTQAKPLLRTSEPDRQLASGFYRFSTATSFVATGWRATMFLARDDNDSVLFELHRADFPAAPTRGRITINGKNKSQFVLHTADWEIIEVPVQDLPNGLLVIEILVEESQRTLVPSATNYPTAEAGFLFNGARGIVWRKSACFERHIIFHGAEVISSGVKAGKSFKFRMYWRCEEPIENPYSVMLKFTHDKIFDDLANPLRRFLVRQKFRVFSHSHIPGNGRFPIPTWPVGNLIIDDVEITPPQDAEPGNYYIEIGLVTTDADQVATVATKDWPLNENRLVFGSLMIAGDKSNG